MKRQAKTFDCQTCGAQFKSRKASRFRVPKYCSTTCYGKSLEVVKTCAYCHGNYQTGNDKYCSLKCAGSARVGVTVWSKPAKEYPCLNCGKTFASKKGCATRTPKFCSRACAGSAATVETRARMSRARLGRAAWNKGVAMWADRPHPRGTLGKKMPHVAGENSPFWKGGITSVNQKIRRSAEYKAWREAVFIRDDYTCRMCQQRGGRLNADHIKPFALFPDLRFEVSNGRTLCEGCHRQTDTYGGRMLKLKVEDFSPELVK